MADKFIQILDDKKTFVSWTILVAAVAIAIMAARTMLQIEQIAPVVKEFSTELNQLKTDVAVLQTNSMNINLRITKLER